MFQRVPDKKVDLKDFTIKSVIGRGSFGKVFLVQKNDDKAVYAMKSLRKDVILDYDQIESTLLERDILLKANHPFMVGMEYVFQTDQRIFFVMKFVRGGELYMHLRKQRQFSEERAKFYAATVALAIGHLHAQHIVYRDLKPENILMGADGYLCVADFGLAKILSKDEKTYSFCGTPEYLAPEVLQERGHSYPVDWWTLGVLTYEMIVGFPPFYTGSPDNKKMFEFILKKPVYYPDAKKHGITMSPESMDFINKCLNKNPDKRLGTAGGVEEIISHPWFDSINFEKLLAKELKPEFKPMLSKDILDVSNFDEMFT
jgi:serine/threonine protein kinase